jgi:hypothetical protein
MRARRNGRAQHGRQIKDGNAAAPEQIRVAATMNEG